MLVTTFFVFGEKNLAEVRKMGIEIKPTKQKCIDLKLPLLHEFFK